MLSFTNLLLWPGVYRHLLTLFSQGCLCNLPYKSILFLQILQNLFVIDALLLTQSAPTIGLLRSSNMTVNSAMVGIYHYEKQAYIGLVV